MSDAENKVLVDESGLNSLDPRHEPVPLPAGSFDIDLLKKGLNASVRAAEAKRHDARVDAMKAAAGEGTVLDRVDDDLKPGYQAVEVVHAELGLTERAVVFNPAEAEAAAAAQPETEKE